jgi:hypothetical protein
MIPRMKLRTVPVLAAALGFAAITASAGAQDRGASPGLPQAIGSIEAQGLTAVAYADGSYAISASGIEGPVIRSDVEAVVDAQTLRSSAYPRHLVTRSELRDDLGAGPMLVVTHTGLAGKPDLVSTVRLMQDRPSGEILVEVKNNTGRAVAVQSIRSVHATAAPVLNLGGPAAADRILSDSYSEDRPQLAIRELADAPKGLHGLHRAVGCQLIYNRRSGQSLFLGALSSERLLTIFHLRAAASRGGLSVASYDAEATGTTEILKGESLKESPAAEQVTLSLQVNDGESLSSERLMFAVGADYHAQLDQYGRAVRLLHHARVEAPTPIGWWSWTAYYFGLSEATAATNADWLSANLARLGYSYFHIDEGYQYARGEYTTADAELFPRGIGYTADRVRHAGLTFGLWTAPFEVSERAWVYRAHPEWLLHNAAGAIIHIGFVTDKNDPLYVLDVTNPGAEAYLRQTYRQLRDWGVRFIKMDFMDDTAVEGAYFRANTTALEAQRIGLKIIREAVGDEVVLDKDGSPILNPVGIVDAGRISQDTGHTFEASRDAATGIAARYYINRNFFIADPDAFTVSTQTVDDQSWHGGARPLTLDEARVSIALAAVSGGMFEIGDDLPTLGASPDRLALVQNADLIEMARLGRASNPVDLMTYAPSDLQPSVFLLQENSRQSILTLFNWSDVELKRKIDLGSLGFRHPGDDRIADVLGDPACCKPGSAAIEIVQQPHSVRMLKIVDGSVPEAPPPFDIRAASAAGAGAPVRFEAAALSSDAPLLTCHWDFGDGSAGDGMIVEHAFTHAGDYEVRSSVTGVGATANRKVFKVTVTGDVATRFDPAEKKRP